MLKSWRAWAVLLAVAFAATAWWFLGSGRLDRRTRAILVGASKVEVFRLDGEGRRTPKAEGETRLGGYKVKARGEDLGPDFASRLATVLFDEATYTETYANCFWPGVGYRVWKGDEAAEVLICFRCDNLYWGPPSPEANVTGSFRDSPSRVKLVRLAKEAFPDDKEIQGLKDE
jgi:hypothetical protein